VAAQHHDATLNEDGPYTTPLDSTGDRFATRIYVTLTTTTN
jgi:hypothetical protein